MVLFPRFYFSDPLLSTANKLPRRNIHFLFLVAIYSSGDQSGEEGWRRGGEGQGGGRWRGRKERVSCGSWLFWWECMAAPPPGSWSTPDWRILLSVSCRDMWLGHMVTVYSTLSTRGRCTVHIFKIKRREKYVSFLEGGEKKRIAMGRNSVMVAGKRTQNLTSRSGIGSQSMKANSGTI